MATFLEQLNGGPRLGLGNMYPTPGIIERIGPDWDWVWIDGQHGEMGYADLLAAVRACNLIRRPALVRVPGQEAGPIGKALDTAADAVMVPMVSDADQARAIVQAAKFAPLGSRSYGARRNIDLFGRGYSDASHPQPLLVCQIENESGLKNAESIAAVEGVDALFFGADDMALERGMAMDQPKPAGCFDAAQERMARAARANGKIAGGVFANAQALSRAIEWGYTLVVGTADVALLATGSQAAAERLRQDCGLGDRARTHEDAVQQDIY